MIAITTLRTCRIGTGFTAESKFLVRKSKKNLGQKKPSIAPASWSGIWVSFERVYYLRCLRLTCCRCENDETGPMILDQFAHAAARREEETPMGSLSDVGADTAIRFVVVHSSQSMYSKALERRRRCGVRVAVRQIDRLVNDGIRGIGIRRGKEG